MVVSNMGIHKSPTGADYARAKGVSIEMTMRAKNPPLQYRENNGYLGLALYKASVWPQFMQWTDKVWQSSTDFK